jgi:hypothetical protein
MTHLSLSVFQLRVALLNVIAPSLLNQVITHYSQASKWVE